MVDISCLQKVLSDEAGLLEEMAGVEEKMMQILIEGDAKALQELNLHKEKLAQNMEKLEEKRRALLPAELTLKELCRRESSAAATELEKLRRRILQYHGSLQKKLKINRNLLRHNLQFTEHALNILFPHKDEQLYAASGKVEDSTPDSAGLLDSSV